MDEAKRRILLIDDDTNLLLTLSDFLRFEGYEVTTASSGEQGLQVLGGETPDLIVLDMSMPGMGGMQFLKEISDADGRPRYPVLVLTARSGMAEMFADIAVDGFVTKPCDPDDLLAEVGRILFQSEPRAGQAGSAARPGSVEKRVLLGMEPGGERDAVRGALVQGGWVVDAVGVAAEVLERAIMGRPDVVVMSGNLGGNQSGVVLEMLRGMPKTREIPVAVCDAPEGDADRVPAPGVERIPGRRPETVVAAVRRLAGRSA